MPDNTPQGSVEDADTRDEQMDTQSSDGAQASQEEVSYDEGGVSADGTEEPILDAVQRPTPMSYIKGIVGIMAAMGALLGAGVYLVASFGGRSMLPGIVSEFSGTPGVDEGLAATHQLTLAYMANELAIFLAFVSAPIFGTIVLFKMEDTKRAKMAAAGVGVAAGTVIFSFLVIMIASMVAPTGADIMAIEDAAGNGQAAAGPEQQMLEGTSLGSMEIGSTVINSALIGIPAGIAAASIIYFDDQFFN